MPSTPIVAAPLTLNSSQVLGNVFAPVPYTVATLPSPAAQVPQGSRAFVTDASGPAYLSVLAGGGFVTCGAFFNGVAWVAG